MEKDIAWYSPIFLGISIGLTLGILLILFELIVVVCFALAANSFEAAYVAVIICSSITMVGTIWMLPSIMHFLKGEEINNKKSNSV